MIAGASGFGRASNGRAVYDSRAWHRTSIPLAMVTPRGRIVVVSGSTMASRGRSAGWLMPVFTWSAWIPRMQTGVLSAPVPAVVGMAISGLSGCVGARPAPIGGLR